MKQLKNQQGYALLIVLLIIVLFLSISATFMAGSLSNAKQEKTVDTTNQSVASAEMGVRYYTADFKRELELIKLDVSAETQLRINDLIACIQPPRETRCDSDAKIDIIEDQIDEDMRALYIQKILAKVNELNALAAGTPVQPFTAEQISYAVSSAAGATVDSTGTVTTDPDAVKKIKVDLVTAGTSEAISKELKALFNIQVPDTFLNPSEALTIETVINTTKPNVTYTDIFDAAEPTISCTALLADLTKELKEGEKRPSPIYECKLAEGETLTAIISLLKSKGFSPTDFKVFTDDFAKNVCPKSCNILDLEGINLSVDTIDENAFNNMNNLINANIIVNGVLASGNNLINLGKNDSRQIIIVKELDVGSNIQNLYYTNLLVLGDSDATEKDSKLQWGSNFEVDNYSKLCIDIDQILPEDLKRLSEEIKFTNSGSLIYYSRYAPDFFLKDNKGFNDTARTTQFVKRSPDYTTFLAACDVKLSQTIIDTTEVAVPNVLEPDFDFEVEY
ncbi:hypothetical protein [Planococcus chinensis]|uniref:Type 4 fimbrial biogenesis protein PilX N-terminal domain-containing protein n=1 Tax=Planococcus chinensis TaxID=272917 RepID=A0ABW4QK12_9BACL